MGLGPPRSVVGAFPGTVTSQRRGLDIEAKCPGAMLDSVFPRRVVKDIPQGPVRPYSFFKGCVLISLSSTPSGKGARRMASMNSM